MSHPWIARRSLVHGFGLFARTSIHKGQFIIEYVGENISKQEGNRREIEQYKRAHVNYIFELDSRTDIDGDVSWNPARFINHSCSPNCHVRVQNKHIRIYANRDISKGEELSYDYGFDLKYWMQNPCRCGSKNCIGHIVAKEHRGKLKKLLARLRNA